MTRVTLEMLLDLHDSVLRASGGLAGVRDRGALINALAKPYAGFSDMDLYPSVHNKAAALLHGVAKAHGFADGNKRTALMATALFYALNGWTLKDAVGALGSDLGESLILLVAASVITEIDVISESLRNLMEP